MNGNYYLNPRDAATINCKKMPLQTNLQGQYFHYKEMYSAKGGEFSAESPNTSLKGRCLKASTLEKQVTQQVATHILYRKLNPMKP